LPRHGEQVRDKIRRVPLRTALQCDVGLLGEHHHRIPAAPGDALRLAAQGGLDELTQLRFGRLQLPLSWAHPCLFNLVCSSD